MSEALRREDLRHRGRDRGLPLRKRFDHFTFRCRVADTEGEPQPVGRNHPEHRSGARRRPGTALPGRGSGPLQSGDPLEGRPTGARLRAPTGRVTPPPLISEQPKTSVTGFREYSEDTTYLLGRASYQKAFRTSLCLMRVTSGTIIRYSTVKQHRCRPCGKPLKE